MGWFRTFDFFVCLISGLSIVLSPTGTRARDTSHHTLNPQHPGSSSSHAHQLGQSYLKGDTGRIRLFGNQPERRPPHCIMSYRPPREGYQPPSLGLPAKPPPPVDNRLSKSPARRRDVPPAVPSPPSHSTRTSPPRAHSTKSVASPATAPPPSSPQKLPVARPDQWYFTPDEVASTPSIIDGLSVSEERLRRAKGVNFIFQAGIMLDLPQITLWVAGVFFHRFYMRRSMVEEKGGIHHYVCLFTSPTYPLAPVLAVTSRSPDLVIEF